MRPNSSALSMETLRRENQRLKARLIDIAEKKAQSTASSASCSSGSHGPAGRLSDDGEGCYDDDSSMGSTSHDMLSPQNYYGYRATSPLKNAGDSIGKEKFGKDSLVLGAFSMDNIGSNSFSWNDGQGSFNKSGGALMADGSKSSLALQRSTNIPPSPDSVIHLHPATGAASGPLSSDVSDADEEKVASDDDDEYAGRGRCRGRSSSVAGPHASLEPVMEQIVRAVLEDKHASLTTPNCYKVLYKYALAQVEIQRKESEVRLAHLRIAKMQREADLQARLSLAASSLPPLSASPPEAGINDLLGIKRGEVETNLSSDDDDDNEDTSALHQAPVPNVLDPEERNEAVSREARTSLDQTESAPVNSPQSTDPFAALLHELIWAIAFTFCLINNLHGPGAKRYKTLKDGSASLKKAPPPPPSAGPRSKDSGGLKRQQSRR